MVNPQGDSDSDDDVPQLHPDTLAALQEFLQDKMKALEVQTNVDNVNAAVDDEQKESLFENDLAASFPEDWQMSQFWYDEETSKVLALEVIRLAGSDGKVACLSCPSVFRACKGAENVYLFEYDRRFKAFGSSFYFYDYNEPTEVPDECLGAYDVVIADPPFLSLECLTKLSETVNLIKKPGAKVILCTGDVMTEDAEKLLDVKKTKFAPRHKNNLGNEFACFANYEFSTPSLPS